MVTSPSGPRPWFAKPLFVGSTPTVTSLSPKESLIIPAKAKNLEPCFPLSQKWRRYLSPHFCGLIILTKSVDK